MATAAYMTGRKKYTRPQAVLLSNNAGISDSGLFVPDGDEWKDFIVLSDHNRKQIDISMERIESKQRMINARMRSYFIANKRTFSLSWESLPSRAYNAAPAYNDSGKSASIPNTVDGGAGAVELQQWYETHTGSFYAFLAYDKYTNFESSPYAHLHQYNDVIEVMFNDFSLSVTKRGQTTFDLCDIRMSLVEV